MTDKKKIITNLQKALNSLDVTSDLRLILIQTIEYLQKEPIRENLKEVDLKKEVEHVKGDYEQADVAWNKDNNMKYIDTENLKSMIRERYNTYKIGQHSPFRNGKVEALREIIELIDSLQQEQPEWMASQGETAEVGYWNQRGLSLCLDKSLEKLGYKEGDKVIVQIRKK